MLLSFFPHTLRSLITCSFILFPFLVNAQDTEALQASYDFCSQARAMEPGDYLYSMNNAKATTTHDETPEGEPVTCIKTFENDQWYRFTGDTTYRFYTVIIRPQFCATPAGMQALIVESEDCAAENFIYRACANPYKMEPLKLFLKDPKQDQNYYIYVDGFDGNVCTYDIELLGHEKSPIGLKDYERFQNDYDNAPPYFTPESFSIEFKNNEVYLSWAVSAQEDIKLFLIERMMTWLPEDKQHGRVIRSLPAENTVGSGVANYRFRDELTRFQAGKEYCYRIVQVNSEGERAFSEAICTKAVFVESFDVTKVFPQDEAKKFVVLYENNKKQDLNFSVLDAERKFLKGLTLEKVKKGDHQFTIDMTAYETGIYIFRVDNGVESFEREFFVE